MSVSLASAALWLTTAAAQAQSLPAVGGSPKAPAATAPVAQVVKTTTAPVVATAKAVATTAAAVPTQAQHAAAPVTTVANRAAPKPVVQQQIPPKPVVEELPRPTQAVSPPPQEAQQLVAPVAPIVEAVEASVDAALAPVEPVEPIQPMADSATEPVEPAAAPVETVVAPVEHSSQPVAPVAPIARTRVAAVTMVEDVDTPTDAIVDDEPVVAFVPPVHDDWTVDPGAPPTLVAVTEAIGMAAAPIDDGVITTVEWVAIPSQTHVEAPRIVDTQFVSGPPSPVVATPLVVDPIVAAISNTTATVVHPRAPIDTTSPRRPASNGAPPPPTTAPASSLVSGASPGSGALPLVLALSLAAAWRAVWLVARLRPVGISLPNLAPPG